MSLVFQFHKDAQDKGVFVVGACGFDSIPSDVGQMHLIKNMEGDVNDIEVYLKVKQKLFFCAKKS